MKRADIKPGVGYATAGGHMSDPSPVMFLSADIHCRVLGHGGGIKALTDAQKLVNTRVGRSGNDWSGTDYGLVAVRWTGSKIRRGQQAVDAMLSLDVAEELKTALSGKGAIPSVEGLSFHLVTNIAEVKWAWEDAKVVIASRKAERDERERKEDILRDRQRAVQEGLNRHDVEASRMSGEFVLSLEDAEALVAKLDELRDAALKDG
jgi:hypothetical protein